MLSQKAHALKKLINANFSKPKIRKNNARNVLIVMHVYKNQLGNIYFSVSLMFVFFRVVLGFDDLDHEVLVVFFTAESFTRFSIT